MFRDRCTACIFIAVRDITKKIIKEITNRIKLSNREKVIEDVIEKKED